MRNYHLILSDGTERNIRAKNVNVTTDGSLTFSNDKETIVAYAAGTWKMVETEQKDDKG